MFSKNEQDDKSPQKRALIINKRRLNTRPYYTETLYLTRKFNPFVTPPKLKNIPGDLLRVDTEAAPVVAPPNVSKDEQRRIPDRKNQRFPVSSAGR